MEYLTLVKRRKLTPRARGRWTIIIAFKQWNRNCISTTTNAKELSIIAEDMETNVHALLSNKNTPLSHLNVWEPGLVGIHLGKRLHRLYL